MIQFRLNNINVRIFKGWKLRFLFHLREFGGRSTVTRVWCRGGLVNGSLVNGSLVNGSSVRSLKHMVEFISLYRLSAACDVCWMPSTHHYVLAILSIGVPLACFLIHAHMITLILSCSPSTSCISMYCM